MKKRWKISAIGMAIFLITTLAVAMLGIREKKAEAMSGTENGYLWFYTAVKGDPDSPATGVYLDNNENETISSPVVVPEYFNDSEGVRHYVDSIGCVTNDTVDSFFVGFDNLSNITVDATNCTHLTTVNNCAVYDRTGITVKLPETVTTIGENAFAGGSQNSVSCENPNITFAGEDHTGTGFRFTGTTRSTAHKRYNASGKFADNGLTAFELSLDANDDTTDPAEMRTGILQDSTYVFCDYTDLEGYADLSTLKSVPTRPHYTFEGFFTESEGGTQLINSEGKVNTANVTSLKNTEDTTAYARWTPDRYTITFDLGEGVKEPFPEQTVTYGNLFDLNSLTFERPGFTFCGWSESEGSSIPAYEDGKKNCATLQSDITLYAIWDEHSYTLSFDGNGGLGSMSSQYLNYTGYYTLPECTFARTNYTFLGWSLSKSTSNLLQPGTVVSGLTKEKDGKVKLYAVWEAKKYTVHFDPNGAGGLVEPMTVKYDQTFALPECGFSRSHHTFLGWGRTRASVDYKASEKVMNLPAVNGDIVLYAVWEEYTYTLSFDSNGGSGTVPASTLRYSQEYALPEHTLTKSHYTFTGWGLSADGKAVYQTGDKVSGLTGTNGGKVVLFAVWEPDTYTIRFNGNGADTGSMKPAEVRYDESHTLSVCGYKKEHYAFAGWGLKNADGTISGAVYRDGAAVKNITAGDSITLYALWREYTYTIRFVQNGGSGTMPAQELAYSREYTLPECRFVRNNYTFAGWKVSGKTDAVLMQPGDKVSGLSEEDKGQVDLCAIWLPHKYTVEFHGNGEDSGHMDPMELCYGQKTALAKNTYKKTGYTFEGWKLSADAVNVAYTDGEEVEDMAFTSKITLFASWKANTYTIHYDGNGADYNGVKDQTVSYGSQIFANNGEYISKKGYELIGWSWKALHPIMADVDRETAMASVDIRLSEKTASLAAGGEITLHAVWHQAVYNIRYNENAGEDEVSRSKKYTTSYCYGESVSFPVLTRPGYVFRGWQCGSTILPQIYNTDTGDTDLSAVWEKSECSLAVQGEGLQTVHIDGKTYEEGMKLPFRTKVGSLEVSVSSAMYVSGYKVADSTDGKTIKEATFPGQESTVNIPLDLTMPAGGLSIDIQTAGRTYAVTYTENAGEDAVEKSGEYSNSYRYGEKVVLPELSRDGYKFLGWQCGPSVIKEISPTDSGDMVLTAVWEKKEYELEIRGEGIESARIDGTAYKEGMSKLYQSDIREAVISVKDVSFVSGYKVMNRSTGELLQEKSFTDQNSIVTVRLDTTMPVGGLLIDIQTAGRTYAVTYTENAGEDAVEKSGEYSSSYRYGEKVVLPELSRDGYKFLGWQCGPSVIKEISPTDSGDMALTAVWEKKKYELEIRGEGIESARIDGTAYKEGMSKLYQSGICEAVISVKDVTFVSGYKVINRSTGELLQEKSFPDQNSTVSVRLDTTMPVGGLCIDIQTAGRTYAIRYDADGGTIRDAGYATSYVYGKGTALPRDVYRRGMKFTGWANADKKIITSISGEEYGNVSLTAVYERAVYNLSIDLNGGSADGFTPPMSYRYDEGDILLPENVVKKGYTFSGWYNDTVGDFITKIDTTIERDQHIYAKWHANDTMTEEVVTIKENGTEKDVKLAEKSTGEKNYYYSLLSDMEKRIYTTLYDFYRFDMNTGECPTDRIRIISDTEFSNNNVYNASAALIRDHAEIFWINGFRHSVPKQQENGQYTCSVSAGLAYNRAGFLADASEYKGFFEEIIENLKKEGIDKAAHVEKIKIIHDYVVTHYSYRNETKILNANTTDETRSVGYMMSHKEGCCVSYARMVKILSDYFNIRAVTMSGGHHMWNGILVDGKWYILDATWDDGGDKVSYNYFLKGTDSVHDESHVAVNNMYINADGSPITEFACPAPPEISREDYISDSAVPMSKPTAEPEPSTTTINGITYKKSGKAARVTKASKKIKKAVIQKKVKIGGKKYKVSSIGKNAFRGCKKLKQIVVKTSYLKSVGKGAFKGCKKLKTVKVPKSCKKKYKKLFKKAGLGKRVTVK